MISIGLIMVGLGRMIVVRTPDRPMGTLKDIEGLANRDDLNIVFVVIDTLRSDRLSTYGYDRHTSPTFDGLARSGILFRDVVAHSTWTKTSMASIWTATHPSTHRVTRYPHNLPDAVKTPAEMLQEAGFRTIGIWRNGWVAPNFGFGQGFDLYYRPERTPDEARIQRNPSAYALPGTDMDLTQAAMEFLRRTGGERFFLYLHYMDVHQYVYDDSADFGTSYSDIYDNSIHWVDRNLSALVGMLQTQGLMKRTLLVIASDHGEAFGEHGVEGHARNLYAETVDVPLLIALPFRLEEGIDVATPVENIDIWPTVLDLAGLPRLPGAQGRSLVPLIEAGPQDKSPQEVELARFAYLDQTWGRRNATSRPSFLVTRGRYRLHHFPCEPQRTELYDVIQDPLEQENLASQYPELVAELRREIEAHADAPTPYWGTPEHVSLSDFELGQLRALGYAVGGEEPDDREDRVDGGLDATECELPAAD